MYFRPGLSILLFTLLLPGAAPAFADRLLLAQSSELFGGEVENTIQVDIRPGHEDNIVDPRAGRVIPLAILSHTSLNPDEINPRTITLEGVGVLLVGKSDKSLCHQSDVNGDGLLDLICNVHITGYRVAPGEYLMRVEAETYDKLRLNGEDRIRVPGN